MLAIRTERYPTPGAYLHGLAALRRVGITPRGLLFLAVEPSGTIHLGVPEDAELVTTIKVGEKMGFAWPLEGRFFHFDSIHRLPSGLYLFNGDRRLRDVAHAVTVAGLTADFLKYASAKNVFFGVTEHQPGAWLAGAERVWPLHEAGFVGVVPVPQGLLARRIMDHRLWLRTFNSLAASDRLDDWQPVYESPLGNVVFVERRIINDRLVLTCEGGLVEVDVSDLSSVRERGRVPMKIGFAVVGRVENQAFAVTQGRPEPWGLAAVKPAVLIGAAGNSLTGLGAALAEAAAKKGV